MKLRISWNAHWGYWICRFPTPGSHTGWGLTPKQAYTAFTSPNLNPRVLQKSHLAATRRGKTA